MGNRHNICHRRAELCRCHIGPCSYPQGEKTRGASPSKPTIIPTRHGIRFPTTTFTLELRVIYWALDDYAQPMPNTGCDTLQRTTLQALTAGIWPTVLDNVIGPWIFNRRSSFSGQAVHRQQQLPQTAPTSHALTQGQPQVDPSWCRLLLLRLPCGSTQVTAHVAAMTPQPQLSALSAKETTHSGFNTIPSWLASTWSEVASLVSGVGRLQGNAQPD